METNQQRDEHLWRIAQKRAAFKRHLLSYLIINVFLWGMWFITSFNKGYIGFPWPAWVTIGWGIGLTFNYAGVYMNMGSAEKEYEKLKNRQ